MLSLYVRSDSPRLTKRLSGTVWQWGDGAGAYFAWRAAPGLLLGVSLYRPEWGLDRLCAAEGMLHATGVHDPNFNQALSCDRCGLGVPAMGFYWDSTFPEGPTAHLEETLGDMDPLLAVATASAWSHRLNTIAQDLMAYPWEEGSLSYHDGHWPPELARQAESFGLDELALS